MARDGLGTMKQIKTLSPRHSSLGGGGVRCEGGERARRAAGSRRWEAGTCTGGLRTTNPASCKWQVAAGLAGP